MNDRPDPIDSVTATSACAERPRIPADPGSLSGALSPADELESELHRQQFWAVDTGLLLAAVLILLLPPWLISRSPAGVVSERTRLEPTRIDIRHAPWYEWTLLEGIGEARARQIVEFRELSGGFQSLSDLEKVPRMPRGWVEKARFYLSCGDGNPGDG